MELTFNRHTKVKPQYKDDELGNLKLKADKITSIFEKFATDNNIAKTDYQVNYAPIGYAIRKTDQRLTQFEVFHATYTHSELPSELKEAAILAFWIVKTKPFTLLAVRPNDSKLQIKDSHIPINEKFARALIFSALKNALSRKSVKIKFDDELKKLIDYAFRYWDFTKEAFILIVEGLYFQTRNMKMTS